jgi:hypothetical protein
VNASSPSVRKRNILHPASTMIPFKLRHERTSDRLRYALAFAETRDQCFQHRPLSGRGVTCHRMIELTSKLWL